MRKISEYVLTQLNFIDGSLAPLVIYLKIWSLYDLSALRTSGTFLSTISIRSGDISSRNVSLMSSYQVDINIPFSGCKMKLSLILSIMIVRLMSRPSRLRSFTRNGPFCDVCYLYRRYLMFLLTSI